MLDMIGDTRICHLDLIVQVVQDDDIHSIYTVSKCEINTQSVLTRPVTSVSLTR